MILSVIHYGQELTALSQTSLLKLDRVQNEAMRFILGTTKNTSIDAMRYLLDLPTMERWGKLKHISMQCRIPRISLTNG